MLSPQLWQGGGFGDGGVLVPRRTGKQEGCVSPSLTAEAPSQIWGSWRAAQELQGWTPSFAGTRETCPLL